MVEIPLGVANSGAGCEESGVMLKEEVEEDSTCDASFSESREEFSFEESEDVLDSGASKTV